MQSRLGSFVEALVNVFIGFWINFLANLVILPLVGFHITLLQNAYIGVLYTVVSVARSYCIRRWFNSYIKRFSQNVTKELQHLENLK